MSKIDYCVENMYSGITERTLDILDGRKFMEKDDLADQFLCVLLTENRFGEWIDEEISDQLKSKQTVEDIIFEFGICDLMDMARVNEVELSGWNLARLALKIKFLDYIGTTVQYAHDVSELYWEDGGGRFCA